MPLEPGSSRAVISRNIHELTHHGSRPRPHKQIVAIALHNADKYRARGGMAPVPYSAPSGGAPVPHMHGLMTGAGNGRSDSLHLSVPNGGFVIPADVVSGVGHGDSLAGARALDHTFPMQETHNITGRAHVRGFTPLMHSPFSVGFHSPGQQKIARGGPTGMTEIMGSAGEYYVHPHAIIRKYGSLKRGHNILDAWVVHHRKMHIKTLQKLKPPVGSRQAKEKRKQ